MSGVIFQRTYQLGDAFSCIEQRAGLFLDKYPEYPELISFNDSDQSVTFSSERLIPSISTNRPRLMLLCSNPHLHSVHQGMFLSPNTKGRENPFWPAMEAAGWLPIPKEDRTPHHLADICLKAGYPGPFEFIFYCYYAFPTNFPEDIAKIFGKEYFNQHIEPEAIKDFGKTIQETSVQAVVTFNKGIFNLVSQDPIDKYIERLLAGDLIHSQVKGVAGNIPIFLTFPTGWRYRKDYMKFRQASLDTIRVAILNNLI
jgi:hypothetical protein